MSAHEKDQLQSAIVHFSPPQSNCSSSSLSPTVTEGHPQRKRRRQSEDATHNKKVHPNHHHKETHMAPSTPHLGDNVNTSSDLLELISKEIPFDEYIKTHLAAYEASRSRKQPSPQKKQHAYNHGTGGDDSPLGFVPHISPIATPARSSEHVVLLYEKCQAHHLPLPIFTYGGSQGEGWSATVSIPDLAEAPELQGLRVEERYHSKQAAKEAVSAKALEALESFLAERVPSPLPSAEKKTVAVNYIGLLGEYQRSISGPSPNYLDFSVGTFFNSQVSLQGSDPEFFGALDRPFPTKKAARQAAARVAVEHIKDQGLWPEDHTDVGGLRKKSVVFLRQSSRTSPEIFEDALERH